MTFDFTTVDLRVVFAALTIIVAIGIAFYFQWWRNRKRLSYEILSNYLVVSAEEEVQDQVEIRYKGQPVTNVRLIVIKLINDGYQPIKKEDFQHSIKFLFPEAKILSAERVKLNPENLEVETNYQPFSSTVEVKPMLFNRKDYLQFKVLLSGYTEMKIDARIVGVSRITKAIKRGQFWISVIFFQIAFGMFAWITITSFRSGGFYFSIGIMVFSILFLMMMARLLILMHQTEPRDIRF